MTAMEILELMPAAQREAVSTKYDRYAKACLRDKTEPLNPEAWLAQEGYIGVKMYGINWQANARIQRKFKEIMIAAGHGSCVERAIFFAKGI
jgi:hypothetical protein